MRRILKAVALCAAALAGCEPPPQPGPAAGEPPPEEKPVAHTNRLAKEKSPYLLQHAHNPVDWFPWGDEAFEKAKKEGKPVFLSVGYSTCHWCHVMERESFENEEIAKILNEHFVAIKVDREERPDVDEIYMEAVQALNNGQGGWPMSVWLTPDRKPFFAGTYFPATDRHGRPAFGALLEKIAEAWRENRADIEKQGDMLAGHLSAAGSPEPGGAALGRELLAGAVRQMTARYDVQYGGFGGAPKFPPSMTLQFLMREAAGNKGVMQAVTHTLDRMARGGMYDQVGGGFARYSTDEMWLVPHFEKMLYDNALLSRTYAEAFALTRDPYYERVAREILDYVLREMTAPGGAFWSATDADSEGEEGKFFVWTPAQIEEVLGKVEAPGFCEYFGVTKEGNFEHGASVLHVEEYDAEKETRFKPAKARLYEARRKRIPPHLDDKILVAWNGMMISSLAYASGVFTEPRFRDAAERAAKFLLENCVVDGRLRRGFREGVMAVKGFLEDYALFSGALLDLYEATGRLEYFTRARAFAADMQRLFEDGAQGAFFSTGTDQETVIARRKDPYDGATPSGISSAAHLLLRLSEFTGDGKLRESAQLSFLVFRDRLEKIAPAQPEMLKGVSFLLGEPRGIVISGVPGEAGFEGLCAAARRAWVPHRALAFATGAEGEEKEIVLLEGRAPGAKATAYVCIGTTCRQPVTTPEELLELLK
ncbi:MAG: thioredoxin domain-containing protein [Planctomycetes bacterium]|nr:thioredoxin domain-containing protein [Planctomycetota bacterium]